MNKVKKIIFIIWIAFLISLLTFYFSHLQVFGTQNITNILGDNLIIGLLIFFIFWILRGFTLIPVTTLILAGILIFPPIPFFIINLISIIISSAIIFYWGKFLGFDKFFNRKYPKQLKKLHIALKRRELPFIIAWSFFPFVPTDMICYVCEILNIKLWKCLLWIAIGEWIICGIYIFWWNHLLTNVLNII